MGRSTHARTGNTRTRAGKLAGPLTKNGADGNHGPGGNWAGADAHRQHLLQLPQRSGSGGRGGLRQTSGGDASTSAWHAAATSRKHPSGNDCSLPAGTATAANSPVAQSGTGDHPTSSLLERPRASSPAGRYARGDGTPSQSASQVFFSVSSQQFGRSVASCDRGYKSRGVALQRRNKLAEVPRG